jgi:hypothetical protein
MMWEAVALVCFLSTCGPVCAAWRYDGNPYPTFEACDRATDRFLETSAARFAGMGHFGIKAGCMRAPAPEKES